MESSLTCSQVTLVFVPQWKTEILDFCPSTRILLIGCKTDLRTDVCTLMELSNQKQTPIAYEQVGGPELHHRQRVFSSTSDLMRCH